MSAGCSTRSIKQGLSTSYWELLKFEGPLLSSKTLWERHKCAVPVANIVKHSLSGHIFSYCVAGQSITPRAIKSRGHEDVNRLSAACMLRPSN